MDVRTVYVYAQDLYLHKDKDFLIAIFAAIGDYIIYKATESTALYIPLYKDVQVQFDLHTVDVEFMLQWLHAWDLTLRSFRDEVIIETIDVMYELLLLLQDEVDCHYKRPEIDTQTYTYVTPTNGTTITVFLDKSISYFDRDLFYTPIVNDNPVMLLIAVFLALVDLLIYYSMDVESRENTHPSTVPVGQYNTASVSFALTSPASNDTDIDTGTYQSPTYIETVLDFCRFFIRQWKHALPSDIHVTPYDKREYIREVIQVLEEFFLAQSSDLDGCDPETPSQSPKQEHAPYQPMIEGEHMNKLAIKAIELQEIIESFKQNTQINRPLNIIKDDCTKLALKAIELQDIINAFRQNQPTTVTPQIIVGNDESSSTKLAIKAIEQQEIIESIQQNQNDTTAYADTINATTFTPQINIGIGRHESSSTKLALNSIEQQEIIDSLNVQHANIVRPLNVVRDDSSSTKLALKAIEQHEQLEHLNHAKDAHIAEKAISNTYPELSNYDTIVRMQETLNVRQDQINEARTFITQLILQTIKDKEISESQNTDIHSYSTNNPSEPYTHILNRLDTAQNEVDTAHNLLTRLALRAIENEEVRENTHATPQKEDIKQTQKQVGMLQNQLQNANKLANSLALRAIQLEEEKESIATNTPIYIRNPDTATVTVDRIIASRDKLNDLLNKVEQANKFASALTLGVIEQEEKNASTQPSPDNVTVESEERSVSDDVENMVKQQQEQLHILQQKLVSAEELNKHRPEGVSSPRYDTQYREQLKELQIKINSASQFASKLALRSIEQQEREAATERQRSIENERYTINASSNVNNTDLMTENTLLRQQLLLLKHQVGQLKQLTNKLLIKPTEERKQIDEDV